MGLGETTVPTLRAISGNRRTISPKNAVFSTMFPIAKKHQI